MDRILITGGTGSIGLNLVEHINARLKAEILIIDNLTSSNVQSASGRNSSIKLEVCDINNREKIPPLLKQFNPNYVFHLAAHFANQNSVEFPFSDLDTNVGGTINVLNSLKDMKNLQQFVYASSSCVYGNESELMVTDSHIYPHETPYAINKYAAELYTCYFNHFYKIPTVSIRLFNTYGPGELAGKYRNVIPNFINNALNNHDIIITGDGTETRDFTYVADTCDLLMKAAFRSSNEYQVYNGGTGESVKIIDLVNLIIELTESKSKILFKERRNWDLVKDRRAQINKTVKDLHYQPNVSIKAGLIKTIEWYKALKK